MMGFIAVFYFVAAVIAALVVLEVAKMGLSSLVSHALQYEPLDFGIGMVLLTVAIFAYFLLEVPAGVL